jgi:hypothetical protein
MLRSFHLTPPSGEQWLHEVKFDGWRIQLHKHGDSAAAFTKNGRDHSIRIRWMVDARVRVREDRVLRSVGAQSRFPVNAFWYYHFCSRPELLSFPTAHPFLRSCPRPADPNPIGSP